MRACFYTTFALLLIGSAAQAQECRPVPISGNGSTPYFVLVDGVHRSNHQSERTAINAAGDSLLLRPDADVRIGSDLFMRERCITLPSTEPVPADTVISPPPAPSDSASAIPISPGTVSIMGYTSADDWGTQLNWSADAVADSFRVYGGANAGGGEWEIMLPGTASTYRNPETYTDVTPVFGCVVARMNDGREDEQQCDGMDLAPMPPGSWGTP